MQTLLKEYPWKEDGSCNPAPGVDLWCGLIPGDPERRAFCIVDVCDENEIAHRTHSWVTATIADGRRFCEQAFLRLKSNRLTLVTDNEVMKR